MITENEAKTICLKYFTNHNMEKIIYQNHSKHGFIPLLIISTESDNQIFHLYDNYVDIIDDIKPSIESDLKANDGYSESFYLDLEDIDNLDLQQYVTSKNDVEDVIQDATDILENTNKI